MTCPDCRDTGIISRPYIAGVVSTMTACTCDAGRAFLAEWDRQSAALRERDAKARAEQEQRAAEARDRLIIAPPFTGRGNLTTNGASDG